MWRSKRPGRTRAASSTSGRLVAASLGTTESNAAGRFEVKVTIPLAATPGAQARSAGPAGAGSGTPA